MTTFIAGNLRALTRYAAVPLLALGAASAHAISSFEDGFELPSIGAAPYATQANGTSFNGWSVTGHSVDIVSNHWQPSIQAHEGNQFLDLAGDFPGTISRELALDPGHYRLSFAYRGNTFDPFPAGGSYLALAVSGVGPAVPALVSAASTQDFWALYTLDFTATTPATLVSFSSLVPGQNGNGGMLIDDLRISAVPEPGTAAIVLAGVGLAGFMTRRRRAGSRLA